MIERFSKSNVSSHVYMKSVDTLNSSSFTVETTYIICRTTEKRGHPEILLGAEEIRDFIYLIYGDFNLNKKIKTTISFGRH